MAEMYTIVRDSERYGDTGAKDWPDEFKVVGLTLEQAESLAAGICFDYAGCTDLFFVDLEAFNG